MIGGNSQPHPRKFLGPKCANDRLEAVVPGGTTPGTNTNRTHWQIQFVVNDDQIVCRIDPEILNQLSDRETTEIHVGLRLGQQDIMPRQLRLGRHCLASSTMNINLSALVDAVADQVAEIVRREL